jgi:hypothetical protein
VNFPGGTYHFGLAADDWARLKVDGTTILDAWNTQSPRHYGDVNLSGNHDVSVKFADTAGLALLSAWWSGPGFDMPQQAQDPNQWYAVYWGNQRQWWDVAVKVNEPGSGPAGTYLFHDWGSGGPWIGIPADHFSATFERTVYFDCGQYNFHLFKDDGAQVSIDGAIVPGLDLWQDSSQAYDAQTDITAGPHVVRVRYYEDGGNAKVSLDWTLLHPAQFQSMCQRST